MFPTTAALPDELSELIRVAVALVLGGIVGWERESTGKAAGLRTHMLVALAAALFVVLGDTAIDRFSRFGDRVQSDPVRIIEAVVAGISFLGAGTIFVSRGRNQVLGLTTAASILATAAIGVAVGLERYLLATGTALLVVAILHLLPLLASREPADGAGGDDSVGAGGTKASA